MVCSSPSSTRPPVSFSAEAITLRRTLCWKESVVTYQASRPNTIRLKTQNSRKSFHRIRRRTGGTGSINGSVILGSTVLFSSPRFGRLDLAPRTQTGQPAREQFVHLLFGQQVLNSPEDVGQRSSAAARFFHRGQQLILIVGFDRVLINLDRRSQPVLDQLHETDLVAQSLLDRALG